jgi:hypothetical protein
MAESGLLVPVLGGVPDLAGFENMAKVEAAAGVQADTVQRLGALGRASPRMPSGCGSGFGCPMSNTSGLASMAESWWRISPADEKGARALLYRLGPERFVDRVLLAWARSPATAHDPAWRALATLPEHWTAPVFPLKGRRISSSAAFRQARRWARPCTRPRQLDRGGFSGRSGGHCRHCGRRPWLKSARCSRDLFRLQVAVLDRRPILEADDRLVLLEADALADEAHVALRELASRSCMVRTVCISSEMP